MNKRNILIISVIVSVLAILIVLLCVFLRGKPDNSDNSSQRESSTEIVSETDDGNWTAVYEATPID